MPTIRRKAVPVVKHPETGILVPADTLSKTTAMSTVSITKTEMLNRLNFMHGLAADMCGNYQEVRQMREELRKTKRMLKQLIHSVE